MTSPTPGNAVKALRPLFAWALLGYVALYLVFEFLTWIVPSPHESFTAHSYFAGFVDLYPMALPLLAVLIATQIDPVLPAARLMTTIALFEYAAALFFGAITFLIGLGYAFTGIDNLSDTINALRHFVVGVAELGFMALAAYAVLRVFSPSGKLLDIPGLRTSSSPRHAPPPPPAA